MKIIYDEKNDYYFINLEYPETELYICGDNIAKVREHFINMMESVFDYTIKDSLKV